MENQNNNLYLRFTCIFSTFLKSWYIVLISMIIFGMSFDVIKTLTYKPLYVASMRVNVTNGDNNYAGLENTVAYVKTLNYVFNGQTVHEYIKEEMGVDELYYNCNMASQNETNIVNITVSGHTKNETYHSLKYMMKWYEANRKNYNFDYSLNVLNDLYLNETPVNQNSHFKNLRNGALIGFGLSTGLIVLYAYFLDTIKTPDDIKNKIDCRLFAKIPREIKPRGKTFWKKSKKALLITSIKTSFAYKEAIKKLRSKIEESSKKHNYKTIMITGSLENEGKSSIAVNIALSLAQKKYKVLIIDGDLRKPSLHKILNIKTNKSINKYLLGEAPWTTQVEYIQKYDLCVLCCQAAGKKSEDLIESPLMKSLMEEVKKDFDYIIIDSSPACFLNESIVLNELVDASLLVVKQHSATVRAINETINRLVNAKNNLIGCIYNTSVINPIKENSIDGYGRYGYNRYNRRRS